MHLPYTGPMPYRMHAEDAGLDLRTPDVVVIVPGEVTVIDTGTAVAIPAGHVGLVTVRSSLGVQGLMIPNAPGVIDAGYRGTLKIALTAIGRDIRLRAGDRIAQLLVLPCALPVPVPVDVLPAPGDDRDGGFGSSGQ